VKERDRLIREWQAKNRLTVASEKTIHRHLGAMR
jgi:hypothetical protein